MSVSEFVCIHHWYTRTGGGNLISGTFQWYTWHRVTYFSGGISQYKLVSVSVCVYICHGLCFSSQLLQRCDNSPRCWLHVIPDLRIWLPLRYSKRERERVELQVVYSHHTEGSHPLERLWRRTLYLPRLVYTFPKTGITFLPLAYPTPSLFPHLRTHLYPSFEAYSPLTDWHITLSS